jgi:hypothetical protein
MVVTRIYGYKLFLVIVWKGPKIYRALIIPPAEDGQYAGKSTCLRDHSEQRLSGRITGTVDQWYDQLIR